LPLAVNVYPYALFPTLPRRGAADCGQRGEAEAQVDGACRSTGRAADPRKSVPRGNRSTDRW